MSFSRSFRTRRSRHEAIDDAVPLSSRTRWAAICLETGHGSLVCNGSDAVIRGLLVECWAGCLNKRVNRSANNPEIITYIAGQSSGLVGDGTRHTRVRSNGDILHSDIEAVDVSTTWQKIS